MWSGLGGTTQVFQPVAGSGLSGSGKIQHHSSEDRNDEDAGLEEAMFQQAPPPGTRYGKKLEGTRPATMPYSLPQAIASTVLHMAACHK